MTCLSFCRLGDVLSSLSSKKDTVPYENSTLTRVLADSLGTILAVILLVAYMMIGISKGGGHYECLYELVPARVAQVFFFFLFLFLF